MKEFRFQPFYAGLSEWLGTDRLDVMDLRQASLWLRAKVIETGVCTYARTPEDRIRWETAIRKQVREGSRGRPGARGGGRERETARGATGGPKGSQRQD